MSVPLRDDLHRAPQTGVPMTALSVVGAQWRLRPQDRRLLWGTFMPWALRAGARSPDLLTLYYEKHFEVGIFLIIRQEHHPSEALAVKCGPSFPFLTKLGGKRCTSHVPFFQLGADMSSARRPYITAAAACGARTLHGAAAPIVTQSILPHTGGFGGAAAEVAHSACAQAAPRVCHALTLRGNCYIGRRSLCMRVKVRHVIGAQHLMWSSTANCSICSVYCRCLLSVPVCRVPVRLAELQLGCLNRYHCLAPL